MARLLVVTAVAAEAEAILGDASTGSVAGLPVRRSLTPAGLLDVLAGGVGPVEAALSSAEVLATGEYDVVLSAGIAGGFGGAELAVAERSVFADLGAELADREFSPVADLGFGTNEISTDRGLAEILAGRTGARRGSILTVATVTGTAERAARLQQRIPDAVAEAMEGFGVAAAAARAGVRFGELRAVSNPVGPRDRDAWQIPQALARLADAFAAVLIGGPL